MDFYATLDQAVEVLRSRGRVSYRALQEHFDLDDKRLEALRAELLYAHADSVCEDGQGLVWRRNAPDPAEAERRQLTVLFCDLVDSTPLSSQLDPEEFREVMRAYYGTCGKVIARFDGYIAQYLGDGLLVFFGYPRAHEDDAQRAVRAGLGIIEAIGQLNVSIAERHGVSLGVRLGCHTGLVVVGEVVGDARHEMMAAGDTPNIAARLQGMADTNTLVVGALTYQLLGGLFKCRSLGTPVLKGVVTPLEVYQVLAESTARSRLEAIGATGLTPFVGRAEQLRLLEDRWTDVVNGEGRVVVLTGEAGIGKSRLVLSITELAAEDGAWLTPLQGSPYYKDTALHPFIDLLERTVLRAERQDSPADKIRRLEGFLVQSGLQLADEMPHFCSLLSIPPTADYVPSELGPDQQKKRIMQALLAVLRHRAAQQPVLFVVEDLHWIDPTTLELLNLVVDQVRTAPILALLTTRPEFQSPWTENSDVTEVDLGRLVPTEAAELVQRVTRGKPLPNKIVEEVVAKTDGVPLFIEELTKTLLESGLMHEHADRYELVGPLPPLAIPNTLHDSLMARLDRLSATKGLAQLCAVIGREFSYALLRAVSPLDEAVLREGLDQLVAAEFLLQQGTPPQATYRFKHALIHDTAYQSLLNSTRQQHHQRIANALESSLAELGGVRPELVAHHYTQAGLNAQAIPYWHAAAERSLQSYANAEAANHATRGLELLDTIPAGPERAKQELALQLLLGAAMTFVSGPHAVDHTYTRALELARQVGSPTEHFPALAGLAYAQLVRGNMRAARALAEEFLALAEPLHDPLSLSAGHWLLAYAAWWQGDVIDVRDHSRRCLALYNPEDHRAGIVYNNNPGIVCGYLDALASWVLGYPTQAVRAMEQTVAHAIELGSPDNIAASLLFSAQLSQLRREPELALVRAEEALAISTENGLHALGLWCLLPRGWALAQQGDLQAGIAAIGAAMDRRRRMGMGAVWPWFLSLAAEVHGALGQFEEAFDALAEAQELVGRNDERLYAAEVYRLEGELMLRQPGPDPAQAAECFEHALATARSLRAKSWELRAAVSMSRMWLADGRREEARELLSPVYHWFTEGFDTPDLMEAKELLSRLV